MSVIRSQCKDGAEYLQALRDEFAGIALQGLIVADPRETKGAKPIARESYELADAMIEARKKV